MVSQFEIENIIVPYLKNNLKIKWSRDSDGDAYLNLVLNNEIISKVRFEMD